MITKENKAEIEQSEFWENEKIERDLKILRFLCFCSVITLICWGQFGLNQPSIWSDIFIWFGGTVPVLKIKNRTLTGVVGLILCSLIFFSQVYFWERGNYARECPSYIVFLRNGLGLGSPEKDIQEMKTLFLAGKEQEARQLYYAAQQHWGMRKDILSMGKQIFGPPQ
jgi:hypothetical protein